MCGLLFLCFRCLDTIRSFALTRRLMHVSSQPLSLTLSQPEELRCTVCTKTAGQKHLQTKHP